MGSLGPEPVPDRSSYSRTGPDPLDDLPTTTYSDMEAAAGLGSDRAGREGETVALIADRSVQQALEVSQETGKGTSAGQGGKSVLRQEVKQLALLAAPATVQSLAQYFMVLTTLLAVGRFAGAREMAAAAVGNTYFNLMFALLLGVSSAFDTLASQAFGAGDRALVVVWGLAGAVVLCAVCVPISISLWFGDWLALYVFRQPEDIANMVASFCRCLIPGLVPFVLGLLIIKGFQAQNLMWEPAWLTVAAAVFNTAAVVICMTIWRHGWAAAVAISLSRTVQLAYSLAYVYWMRERCMGMARVHPQSDPRAPEAEGLGDDEYVAVPLNSDSVSSLSALHTDKRGKAGSDAQELAADAAEPWTFGELARSALTPGRLWTYCKLGIPGGCMMGVEAGAWEVMSVMAGMLGTAELDASTALLSVAGFLYFTFPFGLATASTIRVGNCLGAGQAQRARLSALVTVSCGAAFGGLSGIICLLARHQIGRAFVDDQTVIDLVATIAPITAAFFALDGLAATAGGVLRGMGYQAVLLAMNMGGFWFAGVPLGALFTFTLGWRLPGLWTGTAIGCALVALFGVILLLRVDWEKEAAKSQAGIAQQEDSAAQHVGVVDEPSQSETLVAAAV